MFKKIKERLSKLKLLDYILIILIILLSIVFAVITLKDEKPNNNEVNESDLISLSTYNNEVVNLASPDLTGKEYLGNSDYRLLNGDGITIDYNVYSGIYNINGSTTRANSFPITNFIFPENIYTLIFYGISGSKTELLETELSQITLYNADGIPNNDNLLQLPNNSNVNVITKISNYSSYGSLRRLNFYYRSSSSFNNYQFKLQLEEGSQATDYKLPIGALEKHEKFIYDNGYQQGENNGYDYGFDAGLEEVFNTNNLMPIAELRERGTYGPVTNFFAFTIPINKKVNSITLLNLFGYPLKPINWMSLSGNMKQGFNVGYDDGQKFYSFDKQVNDFNDMIYYELDENKYVEYITIALALENVSMPNTDYDNMIEHMQNNLGVYINNKILNDDAITKFKEIIEWELRKDLGIDKDQNIDTLLDIEYKKGYNKGLKENPNNNFGSLITSILLGVGTVLSIELLPNITIGAIIAVPIVFGIIAFVLGRKKE